MRRRSSTSYRREYIAKSVHCEDEYRSFTISKNNGLPSAKVNRSAQPSPQTRDKSRDTLRDAPRDTYLPGQTSRKPNDVSRDRLWEDPDFRTVASSIYYKNPPSGWPNIAWKRPHEICSDPQLFVDGATRMDVVQGILGDCWLLAAVTSLSTNQQLLNKVVPPDQSFQKGYTGKFRFQFWQYGQWVEVFIDDKLPTSKNKLIYMHSSQTNEFWSALLEKAYAKLNGSYEALTGGITSEALTDFTGGFVQRHELGRRAPANLFQMMLKAQNKCALMGCSIAAQGGRVEEELANGLLTGHSYSVTDVELIQSSQKSDKVQLIRVRNPWGDNHEWNGPWSDGSHNWNTVSATEKSRLGVKHAPEGEFWISYQDFVRNFDKLEICYLGPDSVEDVDLPLGKKKWEGHLFEGGWTQRVNAGGCSTHKATFWTNPQYRLTVVSPDSDDDDGTATILVGLMQKERRKLRKVGKRNLSIGYSVYKAPDIITDTLDRQFFERNRSLVKSDEFTDLREVTEHHKVPPGNYVIVPSTFYPNEEGEFVLRIFTERKDDHAQELDDVTEISKAKRKASFGGKTNEECGNKEEGKKAFLEMAGSDGEIDAFELQNILNHVFIRVFKFDGFNIDTTRSIVALRDADFSGMLGFDEFKKLWSDLLVCKKAFVTMDADKSGDFSSYELRAALNSLGIKVSNETFKGIVVRYSGKDGKIRFDDFVALYVKLKTLFETLQKKFPSKSGKSKFAKEEFIMLTMYG